MHASGWRRLPQGRRRGGWRINRGAVQVEVFEERYFSSRARTRRVGLAAQGPEQLLSFREAAMHLVAKHVHRPGKRFIKRRQRVRYGIHSRIKAVKRGVNVPVHLRSQLLVLPQIEKLALRVLVHRRQILHPGELDVA